MQINREVLTSHPKKRTQRYFRFGTRDILVTIAWAFLVLVLAAFAGQTQQTYVYLGGVVLWFMAMLIFPRRDERLYFLPVVHLRDWLIRRFKPDGALWTNEEPRKRLGRAVRPIMPLTVHGFGNVGLIHNRNKDTIAIVFTASGSQISSMSLSGQKTQQDHLAETIRKMAASVKEPVQVSFCVRARPEDRYELFGALSLRGEPEVLLPKALVATEDTEPSDYDRRMLFLHAVQEDLKTIFDTANDVDMVMVVSVKSTDAFKRALKKRSIREDEFNRQPIIRIRNAAMPFLQKMADGGVTVLDMEGAERFLRKAWDVAGLHDYYARAYHRHMSQQTIVPDEWFPQRHVRVGKDFVDLDGTFGATLKVTSFPTALAEPFRAREFYWSTARWHAHSVIGETVHGGLEYNLSQGGFGIFRDLKEILGVDQTGPRAERHARQVDERLSEIDQSVYTQSFNAYVAVSATSLEELELEAQAEMERLMAMGLSPIRVTGESSQLLAYLSATTALDLL